MKTDYINTVRRIVTKKMKPTKYVPPFMRNSAPTAETSPPPAPPKNRYSNRKSQWQLEKEEEEKQQKLKEAELEQKREFTEDNFPTLGEAPSSVKVWGERKTFASLAVEWSEKTKLDDLEEKQKEKEEQDIMFHRRPNAPLPRFHNIHRFVEPEDVESDSDTEQAPSKVDTEDQGWVLVDRKKRRREKTIEEKLNRPPTPENDDTVWNGDGPDDHETCWN